MTQAAVRIVSFAAAAFAFVAYACGGSSGTGLGGLCGTGCPANRTCDPQLGCVACTGDGQCGAGAPFCIAGSCEACRTNADCPASAPSCLPRSGLPVT
jgi:hypothetical protein